MRWMRDIGNDYVKDHAFPTFFAADDKNHGHLPR